MVLHKNWPILLLNHKQDYIETGGLQWGFRSGSRCQVGRHQDQSSGSSSSHRNWNASSSSWSRRNQPGLLKLLNFFIAKVFCFSFSHLTWSLFDSIWQFFGATNCSFRLFVCCFSERIQLWIGPTSASLPLERFEPGGRRRRQRLSPQRRLKRQLRRHQIRR